MPSILAMAILGIPLYLCMRHFKGDFIKVMFALATIYRALPGFAGLIFTRREARLSRR